jgi:ribosomal protein L7/L12
MSWYWVAVIAAVVLLAIISRRGEKADSTRARMDEAPPSKERIDALIRARQKIEAIKQYRALHGVDLKSAKDAVEARARELGRRSH